MRRFTLAVAAVLALSTVFVAGPVQAVVPAITLNQVPAGPLMSGEAFTLGGEVDTGDPVTLELNRSAVWTPVATATPVSNAYAFNNLSTTAASATYRVTNGTATSEPLTVTTTAQTATLTIIRDVLAPTPTAKVEGTVLPARAGRSVALQYKSGSSWKQVVPTTTGADGTFTTSVSLTGLSQWKTRDYRVLAAAFHGSKTVASLTVKFMPGPATLGEHVLRIYTNSGVTPTKKGVDYLGTVSIDGAGPLALETIAVRGNTTATKPKKPYKMKFMVDTAVYGMPKEKTWVLLANYIDRTLIRTKIGLDVGRQMENIGKSTPTTSAVDPTKTTKKYGGWVPASVFAELFINDQYLGSYQVTESIKISGKRVDISSRNGQIIEFDPHWQDPGDDTPGFMGNHKQPYSFKDPDTWDSNPAVDDAVCGDPNHDQSKNVTNCKFNAVKARILAFENVLYGQQRGADPTDTEWYQKLLWPKYLDFNSAVDYYIAREFVKDNDSDMYRSNFFSISNVFDANAKFVMGPVWDMDRSAGIKPGSGNTKVASPTGWWMRGVGTNANSTHKNHWFTMLVKDPDFIAAVKARWAVKVDVFKAISTADTADVDVVDADVALLGPAALSDRSVWNSSGSRYAARASSYPGEIAYVKAWYLNRFRWMDGCLTGVWDEGGTFTSAQKAQCLN